MFIGLFGLSPLPKAGKCSATPLSEIFGLKEKSSPVLEVLAEQQSIYFAFC